MYRSGFILVGALLLCSSLFAQAPTLKQDAPGDFIGKKGGETREITLPGEVTLKLIWCPPATFTMGEGASAVEVTLTQGFWAAATETTQGQWTSVMGTKSQPWVEHGDKNHYKVGPNFPATYIIHGANEDGTIEADSATEFCEKLTEIEHKSHRLPKGWKYALPTEAQWECICRAGTKTKYSFGDSDTKLGEYAWFAQNAFFIGEEYAHAVASKKANPWGFFDLHGNVWEWCRDGYDRQLPGGADPFVNPAGEAYRIYRGGSWFRGAEVSQSAYRGLNGPSYRDHFMGFRLTAVPVE